MNGRTDRIEIVRGHCLTSWDAADLICVTVHVSRSTLHLHALLASCLFLFLCSSFSISPRFLERTIRRGKGNLLWLDWWIGHRGMVEIGEQAGLILRTWHVSYYALHGVCITVYAVSLGQNSPHRNAAENDGHGFICFPGQWVIIPLGVPNVQEIGTLNLWAEWWKWQSLWLNCLWGNELKLSVTDSVRFSHEKQLSQKCHWYMI